MVFATNQFLLSVASRRRNLLNSKQIIQIFKLIIIDKFIIVKSYFIRKNIIFIMWNGKISIFIEHKLSEDFAKKENFAKIHRNSRTFWTKINEFRSFIFAPDCLLLCIYLVCGASPRTDIGTDPAGLFTIVYISSVRS